MEEDAAYKISFYEKMRCLCVVSVASSDDRQNRTDISGLWLINWSSIVGEALLQIIIIVADCKNESMFTVLFFYSA